ncbi:hypothetical protein DGWBC_0334 [Dehalogenimonas sp. WBC-2]|nr:hypothetical protein DGWBC_0334 [Dehalogenimonas sp. WBC-2]
MRPLSTTLLAAQLSDSRVPYVKAAAKRRFPVWQQVYSGSEADGCHAAAFTGDGSMIRARLTPADSGKLYRQRVAEPGAAADFSQWVFTGQTDAVTVAMAAIGAEISIVWIKRDRSIRRIVSSDNGLNWSAPELIDYTPTTAINGLAAVYKPDGGLAIFFADQSTLYVKKRIGGTWQPRVSWNKTTGTLSGVDCVYDGDFKLMLTGQTAAGDYRLWSLVYSDSGEWGDLIEIAASPSGEPYEFRQAFLDKADVYRCAYVEKYTGAEPFVRVYLTSSVVGAGFGEGLWTEPELFADSGDCGLAILHSETALWLISPASVWRAEMDADEIDISDDIKRVSLALDVFDGKLTLELDNAAALLAIGDEITFSPGYVTEAGIEVSSGPGFTVARVERRIAPGRDHFIIEAADGWARLREWQARNQLRWNGTHTIAEILAWVVGRVGLKLEVLSASEVITSMHPDFSVNPGTDGLAAVKHILSEVADKIFIEGGTAYLVNPLPDDAAGYSYGAEHSVFISRLADGGSETLVPLNCGQQLYDVVDVSDGNGGLKRFQVTGIRLDHRPDDGIYDMKLKLEAV